MKISIIIPVYNAEKYIGECIDSIINQTYKNFELILIDDGSKDNSGKICDEYAKKDNRIKVIHKENGGVSSARNLGIDNAKGEYIMFVDADDVICNSLSTILENNELYGEIVYFGNYKKENYTVEEIIETMFGVSDIDYKFFSFPCSKFFSTKMLKNNNIRFPIGIINGEDMLFNIDSLYYSKSNQFINNTIYLYRINQQSVSSNFNEKIFESDIEFNKLLKQKFEKYSFGIDYKYILEKNIYNAIMLFIDRIAYVKGFNYKKYLNNIFSNIYIKYINNKNKKYNKDKLIMCLLQHKIVFPLILMKKIIHLTKKKKCYFKEV